MSNLPRVALCCLPTPCHRLNHLSDELGIDLWIKRDDLTGFAGGGNKGRKLEYLMPALLAEKPDVIVTNGASQSNFIRHLGAACLMQGVECHAVVMDMPHPDGLPPLEGPKHVGGNVALDQLFGVRLIPLPDSSWSTLEQAANDHAARLRADGKKVAVAPLGGSSPQGVAAFMAAFGELESEFDWIVVACSSGGTFVGLSAGAFGASGQTRVIGVSCDEEPEMITDLEDLWGASHDAGICGPMQKGNLDFRLGWVGEGYGVASPAGASATALMAQSEGLILEPVYTAKAFAGLLDLVKRGEVNGRVLFWHTGGLPLACAGVV